MSWWHCIDDDISFLSFNLSVLANILMVIVKACLRLVYSVFKGLGLFRPTCCPRPDDLLRAFFFFWQQALGQARPKIKPLTGNRSGLGPIIMIQAWPV